LRVIKIDNAQDAVSVFKKIGVDPYGIKAMATKVHSINILLEAQPCKIANILKQEMISVGGDAAVSRQSVSCGIEATDVLIMGTQKQIAAFAGKVEDQPFGLGKIARDIDEIISHVNQNEYVLITSRREIKLGKKTLVMGILNVTPDSFSDGGAFNDQKKAIDHALEMADQGADIIDIGGESTRPGANSVPLNIELKRVVPVVEYLAKKIKIPISVDTRKERVAERSIDAGAEIINDISALKADKKMAKTVRKTGAALIIMHMRGRPETMQKGDLNYRDLMGEITGYLKKSAQKAMDAGVKKECLVVDPGIGFGKSVQDNYRIIKNLSELKSLGFPIMIGTSRKSFLGQVIGGQPSDRLEGTAATVAASIMNGCHIIRVHDVAPMKKIAAVVDAVVHAQ